MQYLSTATLYGGVQTTCYSSDSHPPSPHLKNTLTTDDMVRKNSSRLHDPFHARPSREEVANSSNQGTLGPQEKETRQQGTDSPALEESDAARIERLGRQRPDVFSSLWAEVGFVFSISMSQVLSVSVPHLPDEVMQQLQCSLLTSTITGILRIRLYCHLTHISHRSRHSLSIFHMACQRILFDPRQLPSYFR